MAKKTKNARKGKSLAGTSSIKDKRKKAYKKGVLSTNSNMAFNTDKARKAKPAGKRKSADGNIYYESRANRSDLSRKKKPFLEDGGLLIY